ncbi:MAG: sugar ABC transporter permease [Rhodobacteraceae bacterium]|nr:MAG: sugar ABC transporter permease [Paracoccaceae bacterium]PCJ07340.1 MAG: sugar ABC transporter permease [Paracoccaceae bacterium]
MVSIPPAAAPAQRPKPVGKRRFATLRTIFALVLREMSTRYGRTPGGYLWGVLEPLATVIFLSLGFSLVLRSPSLGTSFLLFYATGYLPFNFYQVLSGSIASALSFSKPLLKYPAVTWLDAVMARFLLNSLTNILIAALLFTGILAAIGNRSALDLPAIVLAIGLAMIFGLAVGVLNCVLMGLYPVWKMTWGIVTRPLFLASGVLFLYDDLPPMAQQVLWYNPLIHITGLTRTGFFSTYNPAYISVIYVLVVSLIVLTLGLVLMGRYHRVILNR